MKNTLLALALVASGAAFAQGGESKPATETKPATAVPVPTAQAAKPMGHKEARAACMKEDKTLKGAKLVECIKKKQHG
ncbi:MAG: hypothetical protein AB7F86_18520 [Bdellovibrionales bacterium]